MGAELYGERGGGDNLFSAVSPPIKRSADRPWREEKFCDPGKMSDFLCILVYSRGESAILTSELLIATLLIRSKEMHGRNFCL